MQPDQSKAFAPQFLAAAPAASVAIMCQVLDMAEQALKIQMTPDLIAKTTQATTTKVLTKLHVSQDQIQQAIAAGNQQKGA
jgi:predicted nuclease of predicted toxin-antitoxin system